MSAPSVAGLTNYTVTVSATAGGDLPLDALATTWRRADGSVLATIVFVQDCTDPTRPADPNVRTICMPDNLADLPTLTLTFSVEGDTVTVVGIPLLVVGLSSAATVTATVENGEIDSILVEEAVWAWWVWLLIALGVVLLAAGLFFVVRSASKKSAAPAPAPPVTSLAATATYVPTGVYVPPPVTSAAYNV